MAEGVNVAPFSMEVNGVKWEVTWGSDGKMHYAGVDSEGKPVAGDAPNSVKAAAKEYGAQGGGRSRFSRARFDKD
jgi:hypothetical protein